MGPKRLAKNTTVVLIGQIINMAISMIVIIYFARSLGEAGFGIFSFLIAFTGIFAVVADFGLGPILLREMARTDFDPGLLVGNTFILRGILTLVAFVTINILSAILQYSNDLILLINIMMANILFSSKIPIQRGIFESIFRVKLRMEIPVLLSVFDGVVLLTLTALFVHGSPSLVLVTTIYTVSNVPGFILLVTLSAKRIRPKLNFQSQYMRYLLKESLPLAFYVAIAAFYDKIDVLCLKVFTDDVSVGIYSAAMRLTAPLNFLPYALATSFFPLFSKYYKDSSDKLTILYNFGIKTLLLVGLSLAIFVTFMGEDIIRVLYAGKFVGAVLPLTILIWAQAFIFLNFFQVDFNIAVNQQSTNSAYGFALLGVNLVLNFLLIPRWEILGAGIAKLGSVIAGSIYLFVRTRKVISMPAGYGLSRVALFAILFSVFLWMIDGLDFIYVTLLAGLAVLLIVYLLRLYNGTELERLRLAVSES